MLQKFKSPKNHQIQFLFFPSLHKKITSHILLIREVIEKYKYFTEIGKKPIFCVLEQSKLEWWRKKTAHQIFSLQRWQAFFQSLLGFWNRTTGSTALDYTKYLWVGDYKINGSFSAILPSYKCVPMYIQVYCIRVTGRKILNWTCPLYPWIRTTIPTYPNIMSTTPIQNHPWSK